MLHADGPLKSLQLIAGLFYADTAIGRGFSTDNRLAVYEIWCCDRL
jgi:hypothetical protein